MSERQRATDLARAVVAVLVAALATVLTAGLTPARADDEPITWSVRPAGPDGADGRSWVELTLDPGESVTEYVQIENFSDVDVEFDLQAADGYFTEQGRFNMLPADATSTGAGTWIEAQASVLVPAGSSVVVPYTLTVPADATPGDHPAGIAASVLSTGVGQGGDPLAVDSRVGFRVMTRVTGDLAADLDVEVTAGFSSRLNPFEPGTTTITYAIENTGNTRLRIAPVLRVSGPAGWAAVERDGAVIDELAPGEVRTTTVEVSGVWPLGRLEVVVEADATAVIDDADVAPVTERGSAAVTALPWSQLVALLALVLLVLAWVRDRRRRRQRLDDLLEKARAEGRREAATESDPA